MHDISGASGHAPGCGEGHARGMWAARATGVLPDRARRGVEKGHAHDAEVCRSGLDFGGCVRPIEGVIELFFARIIKNSYFCMFKVNVNAV